MTGTLQEQKVLAIPSLRNPFSKRHRANALFPLRNCRPCMSACRSHQGQHVPNDAVESSGEGPVSVAEGPHVAWGAGNCTEILGMRGWSRLGELAEAMRLQGIAPCPIANRVDSKHLLRNIFSPRYGRDAGPITPVDGEPHTGHDTCDESQAWYL